jgi:hypothetical protein
MNWQPYNEYSSVFPKYTAELDKLAENARWQRELLEPKTLVQSKMHPNTSATQRAQSANGLYGTIKMDFNNDIPNIDYNPIEWKNTHMQRMRDAQILRGDAKEGCMKVFPLPTTFSRYKK